MPAHSIPFPSIANGDPEDVEQLMANIQALLSAIEGDLGASNILTDTAVAIDGDTSGPGGSNKLVLADHAHVVRGNERLAAEPTTGNKVGRRFYDTTTDQEKLCIAVDGAGLGTWVVTGNPASTDLVHHGSEHGEGGVDELAEASVSNAMLGRTLDFNSPLPADIALGTSAWVTIWNAISFECHGTQLVHFTGRIILENTTGSIRNAHMRFNEAATPYQQFSMPQVDGTGSTPFAVFVIDWYKVFADGVHTLILEGGANGAGLQARKQITFLAATDVSYLQIAVG